MAYRTDPQPHEPYLRVGHGDGIAASFAEKVRSRTPLIALCRILAIFPAVWNTPDGQRPVNPHALTGLLIFTPLRVAVEQVAKGEYALPDLYIAIPGGRIGDDCASQSGFGSWPEVRVGERALYFLAPSMSVVQSPVPGDNRYRYHAADPGYPVHPDNTITIGPLYYSLGQAVDTPPRTLAVADVLREVALLLATPTATPTR